MSLHFNHFSVLLHLNYDWCQLSFLKYSNESAGVDIVCVSQAFFNKSVLVLKKCVHRGMG